jgi:hypothetical protein
MDYVTFAVIVLVWLLCAFLTTGITVAESHRLYGQFWNYTYYRQSLGFGMGIGLVGGPIALLTATFGTGFAVDGMEWRYNE